MNNKEYLSKEELEKYLNSEMSQEEMHEVELKIEEDNFNDSAFEGYSSNPEAINDLENLKNKFHSQHLKSSGANNNLKILYSIAAVVAVAFMSYFFIDSLSETTNSSIGENIKSIKQEEQVQISESPQEITSETTVEDKAEFVFEEKKSAAIIEEKKSEFKQRVQEVEVLDDQEAIDDDVLEKSKPKARSEKLTENQDIGSDSVYAIQEANNLSIVSFDNAENVSFNSATDNVPMNGAASNSFTMPSSPSVNIISPNSIDVSSYEISPVVAERTSHNGVTCSYIYDLKVIDYTAIYEAEIQTDKSVVNGGLDPSYESEKSVSKSIQREDIIEYVTYADFLEDCIFLYKSGRYEESISKFKIVLKEHPEELNAWFYNGLSYFELGEYDKALKNFDFVINHPVNEFNQESEWHKVLTLLRLNSFAEAEVLLNKIIKDSTFYFDKAVEKIEEINNQ